MGAGLDSNPEERYCPTCERTFASGDRCPDDGTRLIKLTKSIDALIGRELDGRYTIVNKIGQGAMGGVYRATQHSVGREVAIKVVAPHLVADPIMIKRLSREAKLASRLAHPNAVSVVEFGQTDDGMLFLVMELVEGRTLDTVVEAEGALAPPRVVRIAAQICDALEGAHRLSIVHRDLKPANVMLLATGRDLVKVLDFGLAKSLTTDVGSSTMTNAGALIGTPAFLAPELVTGGEVDARADLYSLGCTLYYCASAKLPFHSESVHELIAMHASEPVKPLVGVPRGLANVIVRLLEKEPDRRYQSATEAREAIEASLDGSGEAEKTAEPTLVAGTQTVLGWVGTVPTPPRGSATVQSSPRIPLPVAKLDDEDNKATIERLPALTVEEARVVLKKSGQSQVSANKTMISSARPVLNPPTMPPSDPAGDVEAITARDAPALKPWMIAAIVLAIGAVIALVVMLR